MTAFVISSGVTTGFNLTDDTLTVEVGGVSLHTNLLRTTATISGIASGTSIGHYSVEEVVSGGGSFGDQVFRYGRLLVDSGGVASGAVVYDEGTATIRGTADGMIVQSGSATISGAASNTIDDGFETVAAGGVTTGDTVNLNRVVLAGGTVIGGQVHGSDQILGSAVSTTIFGVEKVGSGGVADELTVNAGGRLTALQGSTISGLALFGGSASLVGAAQAVTIDAGGSAILEGTVDGVTVSSGGELHLEGGAASNVVVKAGGVETLEVVDGSAANSGVISSGGALEINMFVDDAVTLFASSTGATVFGMSLLSGAKVSYSTLDIESGGTASALGGALVDGVFIGSGGVLDGAALVHDLADSGLVSGAELTGSGTIYHGAVGEGMQIDNGGELVVSANGLVSQTTVAKGGELLLRAGATAEAVTVNSGGELVVSANGLVSQTTVAKGGELLLRAGATAEAVTVNSGGEAAMEVVVASGQTFTFAAGKLNSTTVLSGVTIQSGGQIQVLSLSVKSGGTVSVAAHALIERVTIPFGATLTGPGGIGGFGLSVDDGLIEGVQVTGAADLTVGSGGVANGVVLTGNADLTVGPGGVASGVVLTGDADLTVGSGGVASGVILTGSGDMSVVTGGVANGTVVSVFGTESVDPWAVVSGTIVQNGGAIQLIEGASASGSIVSNGGSAFFAELTLSGGETLVYSSGGDVGVPETVAGITLKSGAVVVVEGPVTVQSGATLSLGAGAQLGVDVTVLAGGALVGSGAAPTQVSDFGLVSGISATQVLVMSGGVSERIVGGEAVGSGGRSISALITTSEVVSSGGVASATVVNGGVEDIKSGGLASQTIVSGGFETVEKGGVVSGLSLLAGSLEDNGLVRVGAAQTFYGAITGSGTLAVTGAGHLTLSGADSEFKGLAVISGGTMEAAVAKALGAARVVFAAPAASATLQIDAANAPAPGDAFMNTLSNFNKANDFVDLRSIAFFAGASAVVSGSQLVISDGGASYALNLQGAVAGSYAVTSDGHGGTLINPVAAGFAQAVAGFTGKGGAGLSPASSGGAGRSQPLIAAAGSAGAAH